MLSFRCDGTVGWITLDRPDKLNALTRSFWTELPALLSSVADDDGVRVVVLHGNGRSFCAGADINVFGELADLAERRSFMREVLTGLSRLEQFPKPTIAAVHGHAVGGGCELALMCDIVVADGTATFGMPETKVGVVPGLAVVRGLDYMNLHWLKFMMFTGEFLGVDEARLAGLVNRIAPPGEHLAVARELAEQIARQAPLALEVGKAIVQRGAHEGYEHAIDSLALLQGSDDLAEGLRAFREERVPGFRGT